MSSQDVTLGALIRKARKEKGMIQRKLAEKVGIDISTLSKLESGKYTPKGLELLAKMARELDLDPKRLYELSEQVPTEILNQLFHEDKATLARAMNIANVDVAAIEQMRIEQLPEEIRKAIISLLKIQGDATEHFQEIHKFIETVKQMPQEKRKGYVAMLQALMGIHSGENP